MAVSVAARTSAARRTATRSATRHAGRTRRTGSRPGSQPRARVNGRVAAPARLSIPLTPVAAVERGALAVRRLPESSLVTRISQGRLWIAVLGVLLAGLVALNVSTLSLTSGAGEALQRSQQLNRQNSELRSKLARRLSAENLQGEAAKTGMIVPDPGAIRYLTITRGDPRMAAKRLLAGLPVNVTPAPVATAPAPGSPAPAPQTPVSATTPAAPGTTAPTATPVIQPAPPTTQAPAQPAAAQPPAAQPAATATTPQPAGGVAATTNGQP